MLLPFSGNRRETQLERERESKGKSVENKRKTFVNNADDVVVASFVSSVVVAFLGVVAITANVLNPN